ncbi:hypothetical protein AWENTII_003627 [Aspergillus wentii]|nr:hypothetical protein MW887_011733 [Aspergillus wentii]
MKPATKSPNGHGSHYKEVRFSPTATPVRRAQSVSTSNPASNPDYIRALGASFVEHSRSLLDRQRMNFETERALFAEERELWEKERTLLRLRIVELEESLLERGDSHDPASNTLSPPRLSSFPPRPLDAPLSDSSLSHPQVWEGSSPALRPTRVFNDVEKSDTLSPGQVPSPTQQGENHPALSLDAALSPRSRAADSVPVPIEKLDSKLDGITLRSSALPPEIVARVMTPPSSSPPDISSAPTSHRPALEHKATLKLKLSELGPLDWRLTRDAGHTPMAVIDPLDPATATDQTSPGALDEEDPIAPVGTEAHQPVENSDSYFPDPPDDPALKGPLSLLNDEKHDSGFLQELDQKLLNQAKQALSVTTAVPEDDHKEGTEPPSQGEPELKFKNTTNFGTAFGISNYNGI